MVKAAEKSHQILANYLGTGILDDIYDYDDPFGNVRYYHYLKAKRVKKFLEQEAELSKTFLDAGAGRGQYCAMAQSLYKEVFCFEFDADEIRHARETLTASNVRVSQVDLRNIPLDNETVDAAVCSEVLEHIPGEQKAMDEIYRVMKPGGKLLFSMPNKNSLFYRRVQRKRPILASTPIEKTAPENWEAKRHINFSPFDIEKIAETSGFVIVKRYGVNVLPPPTFLRRLILQSSPLFFIYQTIEQLAEKVWPRLGSFYFLELKK